MLIQGPQPAGEYLGEKAETAFKRPSLDGEKHILTAHLKISSKQVEDWALIKVRVKEMLKQEFAIFEATLEMEYQNEMCFDPEHSV